MYVHTYMQVVVPVVWKKQTKLAVINSGLSRKVQATPKSLVYCMRHTETLRLIVPHRPASCSQISEGEAHTS